jgi:autotransporter-associated beta strand protein
LHVNGTAPGYGINPNDNISWDGTVWATASGAAPSTTWASVSTLANAGFPRFNSTTTPYTVTVNNTEYNAGMFGAAGVTLTINAAGSGNLFVTPGSITGGLPAQGFFPGGGTVIINAPITGTGGVFPNTSGGGNLKLFGNNTYSGGTVLGTSSVLTYFNNNNAFGTGPININGTTFAPLLGSGGATITLANSWTNLVAAGVNFAADPSTPVVLTGPVKLLANLNLRNNGDSASPLTLSGEISGTGGLNLTANNGGTIILNGPNTFTGATTLGVGSGATTNVTVSVSSLNKVVGGAASSSLGAPTSVATGTIGMGDLTSSAKLVYTGAGETSDRVINLSGTTGGAILQADGTGALVLTANNTATVAGAKTLTLQGSNTGGNSIGKIVDSSSGATTVVKAQAGTWHLTGANTYTGGTVVNAGTLYLDNASALASSSSLSVLSAATVNLNFAGTNAINSLTIDGVSQVSGVWGPPGSLAPNQSAIFAGTGYVNVQGKPVVVQQPVSGIVWQGDATSFAFTVGVAGDLSSIHYQWKQNGTNIPGATASSYPIPSPATLSSAGTYNVAVTNAFGFAISSNATLTVRATNDYTQAIRGDAPISYWRLNETNGTVAFDALGTNNGIYVNANLNQPGFSSVSNSDRAIGIPANPANKGIMVISNASPAFSFGGFPFTLEAWGMSTNFGAGIKQRLISTLSLTGTGGYGFGFPSSTTLEFTSGGINDYDVTLGTPLAAGTWYHFVAVYDGNNMNFYLNGAQVGSVPIPVSIPAPANQLALGNNPLTFPGEQLYGGIDEVSIYNYDLSSSQVLNHYLARYSDLAAPTVTTPVVTPPTNYVSLSAAITESAGGQGITYQWYKGSGTGSPISGATSSTLALSNLQLSDSGSYHCVVTDVASHTADSGLATLTVAAIPTDASQLNLTNGLVLHLPFDSDYKDISGRQNDGAGVGAPTFTGSGVVGTNALHYSTTSGVATNYLTLGVRPDLKFGATNDFTVAYWVRGNNTGVPYFCDSTNGLNGIFGLGGGFYFGPSTNGFGSWEVGLASTTHEAAIVGSDFINDGNWHQLVHSVKRTGNMKTYLDGNPVSSSAVSFITDSIDNARPANIGQDGLGTLGLTGQGDIDDLAVWRRTLSDFEVSGIYLAGATNHVSFAPAVANPPPMVTIQIQKVGSQYQLVWTGGGTLQASPVVTGGYTNVTGAASPYMLPNTSSPQLFYRVQF